MMWGTDGDIGGITNPRAKYYLFALLQYSDRIIVNVMVKN